MGRVPRQATEAQAFFLQPAALEVAAGQSYHADDGRRLKLGLGRFPAWAVHLGDGHRREAALVKNVGVSLSAAYSSLKLWLSTRRRAPKRSYMGVL